MHVLIVGGKGQMGQLMNRLLSPAFEVSVLGSDWMDAEKLISQADIVLLSVAMHRTAEVIERIAPLMREDQGICDITSIKQPVMDLMLAKHSGPVLGTHPVFGPGIQNNQWPWVVCEGRDSECFAPLVNYLERLGFDVCHLSAAEHDAVMDIVQGINYAVLRSYVQVVDETVWRKCALADVIEHFLTEDPKLYDAIIGATVERRLAIQGFSDFAMSQLAGSARQEDWIPRSSRGMTAGDGEVQHSSSSAAQHSSSSRGLTAGSREPIFDTLCLLESQSWQVNRDTLKRLASPNFRQKLAHIEALEAEGAGFPELGVDEIAMIHRVLDCM